MRDEALAGQLQLGGATLAGVLPSSGASVIRGQYARRQLGHAVMLPGIETSGPWYCSTREPKRGEAKRGADRRSHSGSSRLPPAARHRAVEGGSGGRAVKLLPGGPGPAYRALRD